MKKSLFGGLIISILFMINFVSAFAHYGFRSFDISNFVPIVIFLILFAIIYAGLSRVGAFSPVIAGVIAGGTAFLTYYYGFYRTGFNLQRFFFDFGVSTDLFYPLFSIIFLIAAIFIIWKFGFHTLFLVTGASLILASLTDIFYEGGLALIIGAILVLIGLFLWKNSRERIMGGAGWIRDKYDWDEEKRQARAIGRGTKRTWGWGKRQIDPNYRLQKHEETFYEKHLS